MLYISYVLDLAQKRTTCNLKKCLSISVLNFSKHITNFD